jgi:cytoskeletal protein CcmA (bactofilin family)
MFGKSKRNAADKEPLSAEEGDEYREVVNLILPQQVEGSALASSTPPTAPEANSSISSSISIVGKIDGKIVGSNGRLSIFGHVEGQIHASTVEIGDGAQIEGNIVAEELTIGGRVKGAIHANRVKLNSTAVVEGDIYHRSLAIEENAQSRECQNDRKMPSIGRRSSQRNAHKHRPSMSTDRAAAHPKASIHRRRRPRRRPPVPILELALTDRPLFTALNHRLL